MRKPGPHLKDSRIREFYKGVPPESDKRLVLK